MKKYWEYISSHTVYKNYLVNVRQDKYHFLRNDIIRDFTVLEFKDWVNIIPVTPDGNIVIIRQYRHGVKEETIEVPGGVISEEDLSPLEAARREMEEETGYSSSNIIHIGTVEPNPAIQNNKCYTFLAKDVFLKSGQSLDPTEAIGVDLIKKEVMFDMIKSSRITHALVVAAFAHYMLYEMGYNKS